jgi:NNP family nitrate/nitrite transporter-like MFS transporter
MFSFLLPLVLGGWGLAGAYLAWLIFLVLGVLLYHVTGLNAYFFQFRRQGATVADARQKASELGQEIFPKGSAKDSLIAAARIWKTWLLVAIYFTTFGGFIALTAWLPTFWKSYYGVSAVTAGGLTALYSLTASLIRVPGGTLSDRFGGEKTAILSLVTMIVGSIALTFSGNITISVIGEVLMALGMGVGNAAVFKLMPQFVPQAVGGAAGWIGGLGAFGGFAIPPILGTFVRIQGEAGYAYGFVTYIALAVLSLILAVILMRSNSTNRSDEATFVNAD